MRKLTVLFCLLLSVGYFSNNIQAQSDSKVLKKSIEVGDAKDVKTDINFFAGELNLNVSTDKLAECFYGYKKGFIRPEMKYKEVGSVGYLSLESEEQDKGLNGSDNKWNLSINKDIKNSLSIKLKAGKANINLEGANLSNFEYKMTAGESHIDLRNTSVPLVKFNLLAGEAHIDLTGKWENDCVADIKGGVGEITVKVPYKTGVIIHVTGVLGEVNIPFFDKQGRTYTNDSYGKTKKTLSIYINGAIGQINVEMEE